MRELTVTRPDFPGGVLSRDVAPDPVCASVTDAWSHVAVFTHHLREEGRYHQLNDLDLVSTS
jgi:pyridoxine 5'-phosphate synthase PdxJ